jgi:hypothetical protein
MKFGIVVAILALGGLIVMCLLPGMTNGRASWDEVTPGIIGTAVLLLVSLGVILKNAMGGGGKK